jgi:hypothetical protein
MGVTPLRLLITSVALVIGAALMPAMTATASPEPVVAGVAAQQQHSEREVAALTQSESRLDSVAQRTSDGGRFTDEGLSGPPLWLLVLLVPILVGGAVGTGVTLRRLR